MTWAAPEARNLPYAATMDFPVGATARIDLTVTDADTAIALGSGDVAVLGTPRVVALLEQATVAATREHLPGQNTTVGIRVDVEHLAATPVGRTVTAEARLAAVDRRRLTFEVTLHDGETVAARGQVVRAVVDRTRFMEQSQS